MLSESRTQHDGVDYVYFRMEQLISILMRAVFMNLSNQRVLDLAIKSWENLKNIENNEELPTLFTLVMSVGPRTIFQKNGCVVVWSMALHRKTLYVSHKSVKKLFLDE